MSTSLAIASGEMSVVTHSVQALTGHAPRSFGGYLRQYRESYRRVTTVSS